LGTEPEELYKNFLKPKIKVGNEFVTQGRNKDQVSITNALPTILNIIFLRFEVFTAATMKSVIFWDVTPCGSYKNRRFGEHIASTIRVKRIGELGTTLAVTSNCIFKRI
jgi:hypothetical protein